MNEPETTFAAECLRPLLAWSAICMTSGLVFSSALFIGGYGATTLIKLPLLARGERLRPLSRSSGCN